MNKLNNSELKSIRGGFGGWLFIGIIAATTFITGILTGVAHPYKCSK